MPDSVPGQVLDAARTRRYQPVASWALAEEVAAVLRRPRLQRRYGITESDVREVLLLLAPFLPSVEAKAPLRDLADRPVVATAVVAQASAIVTGDRDFAEADLVRWLLQRSIEVLSPAELMRRLP